MVEANVHFPAELSPEQIEAQVIQAVPVPLEANQNVPVPNDNELEVIKILVTN